MNSKRIVLFFALSLFYFLGNAQDCTLDIGGKNTETLVGVFQMNEEQVSQMETFRAGLAVEMRIIEEDIEKLFATHPQSSPEELTMLAEKYDVYKHKAVEASKAADVKLISIFNQKQYDRYIELCTEASRRPLQVEKMMEKPESKPE